MQVLNFANQGFCKIAIKDKVINELDKLVTFRILKETKYSVGGTPIVPLLKNGEVRVCGVNKVTVNPQLEVKHYPLPKIEEMFARSHGGQEFSKLDLNMAYQQILLDENSQKLNNYNIERFIRIHAIDLWGGLQSSLFPAGNELPVYWGSWSSLFYGRYFSHTTEQK